MKKYEILRDPMCQTREIVGVGDQLQKKKKKKKKKKSIKIFPINQK